MTQGKIMYLVGVMIYTMIAIFAGKALNIHFIHILNTLMLSSVLYNLLDWKYGDEEVLEYEEPEE